MKSSVAVLIAVVFVTSVLGSSFVIRDGLLSIAASIRDKPLPEIPEDITINALTIKQATVQHETAEDGGGYKANVTIENLRINTPQIKGGTPEP